MSPSSAACCKPTTHPSSRTPVARPAPWLKHLAAGDGQGYAIELDPLPFRLGRSREADFVIPYPQISRLHAEIYRAGNRFGIRDLGSSNGTFVNGRRIDDAELTDGAIVHLACREYRFHAEVKTEPDIDLGTFPIADLQAGLAHGHPLLKELISQRSVVTLFQPIVGLASGETLGYEALGRGTHPELSVKPFDLFRVADRCNLASELSRLFRAVAVEEAGRLPGRPTLFCNVHASELADPGFLESLARLRLGLPFGQVLALEIHEDTVADLAPLRRLREKLREWGILLAYDDFGAGQARLAELAEVPPDFVKLDITLIRDIHTSPERQRLVKAIVAMARDLGSCVMAEGIETEEESEACLQLGCQYGQGFLLGYPEQAPLPGGADDTWKVEIS